MSSEPPKREWSEVVTLERRFEACPGKAPGLWNSRVRESRTPGSVRAKAEWLSYSTTTVWDLNRSDGQAGEPPTSSG